VILTYRLLYCHTCSSELLDKVQQELESVPPGSIPTSPRPSRLAPSHLLNELFQGQLVSKVMAGFKFHQPKGASFFSKSNSWLVKNQVVVFTTVKLDTAVVLFEHNVWSKLKISGITVKLLLFVGHLFSCFSLMGQSKNLRPHQNIYSHVAYNLKSTNLSVHKHVHCRQTTKFPAHKI